MRSRRAEPEAPPRAAEALLVRLLPASLAEAIAGDLREAYARRVRAWGRARAGAWYWLQVLTFRYRAVRRGAARAYGRERRSGSSMMMGWMQDLRLGARSVRKRGAQSALVVAMLALAIGATTVVYGVVDAVLLRPLPYPASDRLVQVWPTYLPWRQAENPMLRAFAGGFPVSFPVFEEWRALAGSVEAIGAFEKERVTVSGGEHPERLAAVYATAGVFEVLGTAPALGRVIGPADDHAGGPALAVLSHDYWLRVFGGARDVLGRGIRIDERTYTVVGVMPRGFYFPDPEYDVWLSFPDAERARPRDSQFLEVVARLRPETTVAAARRDFEAVTERVQETRPEERGVWGVRVESRLEAVVGNSRPVLLLLLGAAGLVLVIASANVVNLLLVRATTRRHELVVRAALGADRRRLVQALMGESLVLALLGGVGGAALAALALPVVAAHLPASLPRIVEIRPDVRVFAFAAAVTLCAAFAAGVGPAWAGSRNALAGRLRDEARGTIGARAGDRTRSVLVVVEVALAFLLLAGAGLLGRSLLRLNDVDPGFDRDGLVVAQLHLPSSRYAEPTASLAFAERVRARVAALPGVTDAAIAEDVPFTSGNSAGSIVVQGGADGADLESNVAQTVVSDDYVETMRIPLLAGRTFDRTDRVGAEPVTLISQSMAERFWPGASAIGARVRDGGIDSDAPWLTVIGVVGDIRQTGLAETPTPRMYLPLAQRAERTPDQILLVRVAADPATLLTALPAVVRGLDPDVAVARVARIADLVARSTIVPRLRTILIGALALLATVLSIAGLYGVLAMTVALGSADIGLRIALGARPARILGDVVRRGVALALAGIAIGLAAALVALRALERFLFDTSTSEPATLLGIAALLIATAAAAAFIPARRAARVDPLDALRMD